MLLLTWQMLRCYGIVRNRTLGILDQVNIDCTWKTALTLWQPCSQFGRKSSALKGLSKCDNLSLSEKYWKSLFITSLVSRRGNRIQVPCFRLSVFPCIRVSVCQFVSALTAKPLDIRTQNFIQGLTLIKSQTSSMVKVDITEWHQIMTVWPKRLWHIRGRCVNAGAFSSLRM